MTREEINGLLALSGIQPVLGAGGEGVWEIPDGYVRDRAVPWWLVRTDWGMLKIGWRKRVINIDWEDTPVREKIIDEVNITSEETYVHAWSKADAVRYLTEWRKAAQTYASRMEAYRIEQEYG
ncbi:hypothetical protein CcrBL47_gp452 [Caulobacter phage BL47]|nr:hypothetical protein CcrBL47_gp452 [Caulobacter phage BL47]